MYPKISVIIPVYNAEKYIERCIKSLLSQTITDMQIIIVNDGSTDETIQICETLQQSYSGIELITIPNRGVSAARNTGLQKTHAEFITFVDADDWLEPDTLERMLQGIQSTEADIACCEYSPCSNSEKLSQMESMYETVCYNREQYIEKRLLGTDTRCWSKLYRKSLVDGISFPEDITIGEDLLFLVYLLPRIKKVAVINYSGYCYYINRDGAMLKSFKPSYMDQITCWKQAQERICEIYPKFREKVTGKLLMSIMLTAGKLSRVKNHKLRAPYVNTCKEELKIACKLKGAMRYVDSGYRIKISVFKMFPDLYLWVYGILKR